MHAEDSEQNETITHCISMSFVFVTVINYVVCALHVCRWDYSHDDRDNEIQELKRRLVESERKSKEEKLKAANDSKVLKDQLQVCACA